MPAPYVAEAQTARWTSDAVRQAFRDLGFQVTEWPLTQHLEKQIPADSAFFSPELLKIFGFQYKTIYHNGDDYWMIDSQQHASLQTHPWIYYCCSEIRDPRDHGLALHAARIYQASFPFQPRVTAGRIFNNPGYVRWWAFYQRLKSCRFGVRITSRDQLEPLLGPVFGEARRREVSQMTEVFVADIERKAVATVRLFQQ